MKKIRSQNSNPQNPPNSKASRQRQGADSHKRPFKGGGEPAKQTPTHRSEKSSFDKNAAKSSPKADRNGKGRNAPASFKKRMADDRLFLYGLHTVNAALANDARRKHVLYTTENAANRLDKDALEAALAVKEGDNKQGLRLETVDGAMLDQMVNADAVHQGVVLECAPLQTLDASELFHLADDQLLLILDQITDPHNVGAILRSAVAMGVQAVLTTSRNSALETAVLAKSASGALDMIKIVHLRNLSKGIDELNTMGFATIGLDSEGPEILEDTLLHSDVRGQKARAVALVLGSEGKGLREQTRQACSALARLDMPGRIKSLNVSNAAALSLYMVANYLRGVSK